MSVDLDKATTRNFLVGLRSFVATFEAQREAARRDDAMAITESGEHYAQAVAFSVLLPRLQHYSFVTMLAMIAEVRLTVYCQALHNDHVLPTDQEVRPAEYLDCVRRYLADAVNAEPPADLWQWMLDIAALRDFLVTSHGNLSGLSRERRRDIDHLVRRRPGLSVVPDEQLFNRAPHATLRKDEVLRIGTEFCLEAVTAVLGLFGYLYQHREPVEH